MVYPTPVSIHKLVMQCIHFLLLLGVLSSGSPKVEIVVSGLL